MKKLLLFLVFTTLLPGIKNIYGSFGYNMTEFLHFNLQGEFDGPLIWKNAYKTNFIEGWGDIPDTINVAVKPLAKYRFFSYGQRDIKILLDFEKLLAQKPDIQIGISINNRFVKNIRLNRDRRFFLNVRKKMLINGFNFLSFKVKGLNTLFKRKKYNENIVRIFKLREIKFAGFPIDSKRYIKLEESDSRFFQPANTTFSIGVDPKRESSVKYGFVLRGEPHPGQFLKVRCRSSKGGYTVLGKINVKKGITKHALDLSGLKGEGVCKLLFTFSSEPGNNFLVWEVFKINSREVARSEKSKHQEIDRPNIVFIVLDAARADVIGKKVFNSEISPNINRFCKEATVYRNFFTTSPYTSTSIATFLSGLFPEVHNLGKPPFLIPDNVKLLPDFLKLNHYKTYMAAGNPLLLHSGFKERFDQVISLRPDKINYGMYKGTSFNNEIKLIRFLNGVNFSKPVFLYVHLLPPHYPYFPPLKKFRKFFPGKGGVLPDLSTGFNDFSESFLRTTYKKYLNNMHYSDHISGLVIDNLKKRGVYDKTLLIMSSDHGEAFGEHGFIMHGYTNYNEMIKIFFAVKFPFQKKSRRVSEYFSNVDFSPSLLKLLKIDQGRDFQGRDGMFKQKDIHDVDDPFLYSTAITPFLNSSIFNKEWKYIFNSGKDELYSVKKDRYEKNNLTGTLPVIASDLKKMVFEKLIENRILKNLLNIKSKKGKITGDLKKELKALGYL